MQLLFERGGRQQLVAIRPRSEFARIEFLGIAHEWSLFVGGDQLIEAGLEETKRRIDGHHCDSEDLRLAKSWVIASTAVHKQ
jgi:hypothetical protein